VAAAVEAAAQHGGYSARGAHLYPRLASRVNYCSIRVVWHRASQFRAGGLDGSTHVTRAGELGRVNGHQARSCLRCGRPHLDVSPLRARLSTRDVEAGHGAWCRGFLASSVDAYV
jgi:hypothetical protein